MQNTNEIKETKQERAPEKCKSICMIASTSIAGTGRIENISNKVAEAGMGSRLRFSRDKDNLFDEWAVKVFDVKDRCLGFVSCEFNEIIARLLDGGLGVFGVLKGIHERDNWTEVVMEVMINA